MTITKNHSILISLLFLMILFSCEKGMDTVEFESTVYIPQSGLTTQSVLLGESSYELGIYKAGINQINPALEVHMKIDNEAFAEFTNENPGYELLPEQYYSIGQFNVSLPEGTERAPLKILLKSIDENYVDKNYVLPLSIESVTPEAIVLEEKQTVFLNFNRFRNVYETLYKAKGTISESGSDEIAAIIDKEITSSSTDANSILIDNINNNLDLILTISGTDVDITGGPGMSSYNIKNTAGKTSTYSGEFDQEQQANRGTFKLFYTYTKSGKEMNAEAELIFWL